MSKKNKLTIGDMVWHKYDSRSHIGVLLDSAGEYVVEWRVFWLHDKTIQYHAETWLRKFNGHKKTYVE